MWVFIFFAAFIRRVSSVCLVQHVILLAQICGSFPVERKINGKPFVNGMEINSLAINEECKNFASYLAKEAEDSTACSLQDVLNRITANYSGSLPAMLSKALRWTNTPREVPEKKPLFRCWLEYRRLFKYAKGYCSNVQFRCVRILNCTSDWWLFQFWRRCHVRRHSEALKRTQVWSVLDSSCECFREVPAELLPYSCNTNCANNQSWIGDEANSWQRLLWLITDFSNGDKNSLLVCANGGGMNVIWERAGKIGFYVEGLVSWQFPVLIEHTSVVNLKRWFISSPKTNGNTVQTRAFSAFKINLNWL